MFFPFYFFLGSKKPHIINKTPNENKIEFVGETFSAGEKNAIYSLAKQSTHPLSLAILNSFSDANYFQPDHFVEVSGRGIFGKVNNIDVKIGSEEYVTGARSQKKQKINLPKRNTRKRILSESSS